MALTNAERQARHRERVKARLAAANAAPGAPAEDTAGDDMLALINAHYVAGLRRAAAAVDNSELAETASRRTATLPTLSWVDVLDLVERAGETAWTDAYGRAATEWAATLPPAPEPVAQKTRGRRRS